MTQTVPATCVLGPGKTGLTIGYRVLNLDGTEYSAFSTSGVAETAIAGTYRVAGGVEAPLAGGYVVWGTELLDYAEATVESASANVTAWNGTAPSNLDANGYIRTDVMSWDGSTVDEVYPLVRPIDNSDGIEYIDRIYIRDAMKLAPTAGAAAAGSVDAQLASLPTYNGVYDAAEHATLGALTDYGVPTKAELDAAVAPLALEATAQGIAADVAALPAAVDAQLSATHSAGEWGGAGAWPKPFVYTLLSTSSGLPIGGALIEVYSDAGMTVLVDQGVTDAYGRVRFDLPAGTYHFKRTKTGYTFFNPDTEVQP